MQKLTALLSNSLLALGLLMATLTAPILFAQPAAAQANEQAICEGSGGTWSGSQCSTSDNRTVIGTIRQVVNILIFIVGAVSIIMVVIGGLRYVLSGGDQNSISSAKNTILYAIVGIVVAVAAYAIVNFVLLNLGVK